MGIKLRGEGGGSKFGVHVLVVIFGITSWSIMNGLWVELPLLVSHLPENWTLPSYLTIITQLGNIGPIFLSLVAYLKPKTKLETPVSIVIVIALTLCALLYSFFWKSTAYVAGTNRSVALIGLTFCQAVFATSTSVAYVPFMARLKPCYIASIFIGMGLSGLLPAMAAIGQGLGDIRCVQTTELMPHETNGTMDLATGGGLTYISQNGDGIAGRTSTNATWKSSNSTVMALVEEPTFTVQGFFLMLFGIGVLSLLSVLLLLYHPYCQTEHDHTSGEEKTKMMLENGVEDNKSDMLQKKHQNKQHCMVDNATNVISGHTSEQLEGETRFVFDETPDAEMTSQKTIKRLSSKRKPYGPICDLELTQLSITPACLANGTEEVDQSVHYDGLLVIEQNNRTAARNNELHRNYEGPNAETTKNDDCMATVKINSEGRQPSKLEYCYLLGLLVWINALQTSFLLAIQVYSSLPYGIAFYHGATKAENIIEPLASFLTFWIVARTARVISGITLLGTLFTAYIITMAAMSPDPVLVDKKIGGVLVIGAWVMCTTLMIFAKVSIAIVMRGQGRLSLTWTGACTQLGALLGAVLAYVLINNLHLFKDAPWCH